jgi:hypothetical protein
MSALVEQSQECTLSSKIAVESTEPMKKWFTITPKYTKSFYDAEEYQITISTGKEVMVKLLTFWRWGELAVCLTDAQVKEVLEKETIVVSDFPEYEFLMSNDSRGSEKEIVNESRYSDEEMDEINKLLQPNAGENSDSDEDWSEPDDEMLTNNGWTAGDVEYVIVDGCKLTEIEEK